MSVLVTGGAGYIGAATLRLLSETGESAVVLDNLSRGHRDSVPAGIPFYQGDVGDSALVSRIASDHKIDACIHFAAFAYVGESVNDPTLYVSNNIVQGASLLNSLRGHGINRVVFSSSCTTYGEPEYTPIGEEHPQRPTNFYGWTKLLMEQMLASYSQAYGMSYVALRYFNAAGAIPGHGERHDPETHLIPNVLTAAGGGAVIKVFGDRYPTPDGTAIRDYIHISDLGAAHLLALHYLRNGGAPVALNLGNGTGYSVMEVIESASRVTGRKIPFEIAPARPGDPARLIARADKAREILGWKPQIPNLDDIVRSAWNWHLRATGFA